MDTTENDYIEMTVEELEQFLKEQEEAVLVRTEVVFEANVE